MVIPAMALVGVASPEARARTQRARRPPGAGAVHLRAVDGDRQPSLSGLRSGHASLAPFIGDLSYDSWSLTDDISVGKLAALTLAVALVLLGGIQLLLDTTLIGSAIRATAEDPDTVGLVGVNARRVNAIAAAIAMATVAVAGAFLGMRATFDPYAGGAQLIFAFEASVIGGAGSLWGTLVGGIALGVAQTLGRFDQPAGLPDRRSRDVSLRSCSRALS